MADEPKQPPKPERPSISEQTEIPANVPMTPIGADEELGIFTPASLQRHKSVSAGGILLTPGDSGNAVVELQRELAILGLLEEPLEDEYGQYGERTEDAVRVFQDANGFLATGKVDNRTRAAVRVAARDRGT